MGNLVVNHVNDNDDDIHDNIDGNYDKSNDDTDNNNNHDENIDVNLENDNNDNDNNINDDDNNGIPENLWYTLMVFQKMFLGERLLVENLNFFQFTHIYVHRF